VSGLRLKSSGVGSLGCLRREFGAVEGATSVVGGIEALGWGERGVAWLELVAKRGRTAGLRVLPSSQP
jgi:hypothetical protein